jgi:hypothetical protein
MSISRPMLRGECRLDIGQRLRSVERAVEHCHPPLVSTGRNWPCMKARSAHSTSLLGAPLTETHSSGTFVTAGSGRAAKLE